jgi:short-subunit dehydrogenase
VLLTGASGGLGRAIAAALHDRGAQLLLTGRNEAALAELARVVGGEVLVADLAKREDVDSLPGRAGRVDILVHNAGLPGSGRLETFTVEEADRVLDVNLRSGIALTHALLPAMVERGGGHLVYMCSMAGKIPVTPLYSASKYGMRGFAGALRDDLHGSGVGVSLVFPGPIEEAGLQADSGVKTVNFPKRYPRDVADAVVKGIEKNKYELTVADPVQRFGEFTAALAPAFASRMRRLVGLRKVVDATAEGQKQKR